MDPNKLTQKSQEALHDAQTKALRFGHTEVDGEHLLLALLDQPDGLAPRLLTQADVEAGCGLSWRRSLPAARGSAAQARRQARLPSPSVCPTCWTPRNARPAGSRTSMCPSNICSWP